MSSFTDDSYYTGTTTTSSPWYTTKKARLVYSDGYDDFELVIDKPKNEFKTELIKNLHNIIKELQLSDREISIAAFVKCESDIEKDLNRKMSYYTYLIHPIKSDPQYDPVSLFSYNLAIVSDILEYMPSTMTRANVIKEALTSLKQEHRSYLIITSKSAEDAEKSKDIVSTLNEEDLISLALYASAAKTWKLDCMKGVKFPIIIASNGG